MMSHQTTEMIILIRITSIMKKMMISLSEIILHAFCLRNLYLIGNHNDTMIMVIAILVLGRSFKVEEVQTRWK